MSPILTPIDPRSPIVISRDPNFSYRRKNTSQSKVSQQNQVNFKMIPLGGAVSKQDKYKAVYSPFDQDKVRSRKRHKITKNSKNSQNLSLEIFRKSFFFEIVNSVNISFFDK